MGTALLSNNCNKSLESANPLWFESNPTIDVSSVKVLLQWYVEAL
jgi:hypothetical protein